MTGRRLVVFFDGTWNTPDSGKNPTNVVKMLRAVCNKAEGVSQVCFYDKGVGTGGPIDRLRGGASGKGLTANMVDGYRFLGNNAEPEDEIYVFGFSRGAYTARSLVGFIGLAGLLSPLDLGGGLAQVIAIYRDSDLTTEQKLEKIDALDIRRRKDVRIRCVGVWDTVGSLGIPTDWGRMLKKFYFQDVQLSDKVDVALHAMGIDEKRAAFAPTLWVREKDSVPVPGQIVEQVWFSGVHSNIGGSYADAGLSDITLDWMMKRVAAMTDLRFDDEYIAEHVNPNVLGEGIESRTAPFYSDSKLFPYLRLINQQIPKGSKFGDWFRNTFESFDRRNIPPSGLETINEAIHVSVLERWGKKVVHDSEPDATYRPSNLATAIRWAREGGDLPVVGWDSEVMNSEAFEWPDVG